MNLQSRTNPKWVQLKQCRGKCGERKPPVSFKENSHVCNMCLSVARRTNDEAVGRPPRDRFAPTLPDSDKAAMRRAIEAHQEPVDDWFEGE